MKQVIKRILSVFLCIVMLGGLVPFANLATKVHAEDATPGADFAPVIVNEAGMNESTVIRASLEPVNGEILLYNAEDLQEFATNYVSYKSAKVRICGDIDFGGNTLPLMAATAATAFTGEFTGKDGHVYTISNVNIANTKKVATISADNYKSPTGFFGVANGATFSDLRFENVTVTGYTGGIGILVGSADINASGLNNSTICSFDNIEFENCKVQSRRGDADCIPDSMVSGATALNLYGMDACGVLAGSLWSGVTTAGAAYDISNITVKNSSVKRISDDLLSAYAYGGLIGDIRTKCIVNIGSESDPESILMDNVEVLGSGMVGGVIGKIGGLPGTPTGVATVTNTSAGLNIAGVTVKNSSVTAGKEDLTGIYGMCGGIIGSEAITAGKATIKNCTVDNTDVISFGKVTAMTVNYAETGGIAGHFSGLIEGCTVKDSTISSNTVGGILGRPSRKANTDVGTIVTIRNCQVIGKTLITDTLGSGSGTVDEGGAIICDLRNSSATVTGCGVGPDVRVTGNFKYAGGVTAYVGYSTTTLYFINFSDNTLYGTVEAFNAVSAAGGTVAGGVAGWIQALSTQITVHNNLIAGKINAALTGTLQTTGISAGIFGYFNGNTSTNANAKKDDMIVGNVVSAEFNTAGKSTDDRCYSLIYNQNISGWNSNANVLSNVHDNVITSAKKSVKPYNTTMTGSTYTNVPKTYEDVNKPDKTNYVTGMKSAFAVNGSDAVTIPVTSWTTYDGKLLQDGGMKLSFDTKTDSAKNIHAGWVSGSDIFMDVVDGSSTSGSRSVTVLAKENADSVSIIGSFIVEGRTIPGTDTPATVQIMFPVACDIASSGHNHTYEEAVTSPTCTAEGYTVYTCTDCGYNFTAGKMPALGHSFSAWESTATCTEAGTKTRTCERCSVKETEDAPATGHDYDITVTEPTCITDGYTTYTCKICKTSEVNLHEGDAVSAPGHSFGDGVVTEPTCTKDGFTTYTCERCKTTVLNLNEGDAVSALGHKYQMTTTIEPTCTEDGQEQMVCANCGDATGEPIVLQAPGHAFGDGVVTKPTCTTDGYTTYTCERCKTTELNINEGDAVSAPGHDWSEGKVTSPTCTKDGYTTYTCSRCRETAINLNEGDAVPTSGHNYQPVATIEPTCTEPGEGKIICATCGDVEKEFVVLDALGHAWDTIVVLPTCTTDGYTIYICSRCSETAENLREGDIVPTPGHNRVCATVTEPTCTEPGVGQMICVVCGNVDDEPVVLQARGHSWDGIVTEPTCTKDGYTTYNCTHCGEAAINLNPDDAVPAPGHTYRPMTTIEPTCTETGEAQMVCTVCGNMNFEPVTLDALGHTWDAVVTEPTCTADGYTTYTCGRCGKTAKNLNEGDAVSASGHTYQQTTTTEPTCTEAGEAKMICTACGDVTGEPIVLEAPGHMWDAVVTEATCTADGYTTYTCSRCDEVVKNLKEDDLVPALGHNFDASISENVTEISATEKENGSITVKCSRCDKTKVTILLPTNPVDSDEPYFALSKAIGAPGSTVKVTVSVKNNPGIVAARLHIAYDSEVLSLVSVENGVVFEDEMFTEDGNVKANPYTVLWIDSVGKTNITTDGELATFMFKIAEDADLGDTAITLSYDENFTCDVDLNNVGFAVKSSIVTVSTYLPGDVSDDGVLDLKDVALISRYLAGGWNVTVSEEVADVNHDGVLNLKDIVLLKRYLAGGWGVELY